MYFTNALPVLYDFMNIHYTVSEAQTLILLEALHSITGKKIAKEIIVLLLVLCKQIILIQK